VDRGLERGAESEGGRLGGREGGGKGHLALLHEALAGLVAQGAEERERHAAADQHLVDLFVAEEETEMETEEEMEEEKEEEKEGGSDQAEKGAQVRASLPSEGPE